MDLREFVEIVTYNWDGATKMERENIDALVMKGEVPESEAENLQVAVVLCDMRDASSDSRFREECQEYIDKLNAARDEEDDDVEEEEELEEEV